MVDHVDGALMYGRAVEEVGLWLYCVCGWRQMCISLSVFDICVDTAVIVACVNDLQLFLVWICPFGMHACDVVMYRSEEHHV